MGSINRQWDRSIENGNSGVSIDQPLSIDRQWQFWFIYLLTMAILVYLCNIPRVVFFVQPRHLLHVQSVVQPRHLFHVQFVCTSNAAMKLTHHFDVDRSNVSSIVDGKLVYIKLFVILFIHR